MENLKIYKINECTYDGRLSLDFTSKMMGEYIDFKMGHIDLINGKVDIVFGKDKDGKITGTVTLNAPIVPCERNILCDFRKSEYEQK